MGGKSRRACFDGPWPWKFEDGSPSEGEKARLRPPPFVEGPGLVPTVLSPPRYRNKSSTKASVSAQGAREYHKGLLQVDCAPTLIEEVAELVEAGCPELVVCPIMAKEGDDVVGED